MNFGLLIREILHTIARNFRETSNLSFNKELEIEGFEFFPKAIAIEATTTVFW